MWDTHTTDEALLDHPAAEIETVVVDLEDPVATFQREAREGSRRRSHVLRLVPPFEEEHRAEPYVQEGPRRYHDRDPEPLHLPPGTVVANAENAFGGG